MQFPTEKSLKNAQSDELDRGSLAKNIASNILLEMKLPNTFGLYGDWGTGKSTLLNFLKEETEKQDEETVEVIEFDPWKYENTEQKDLLFALLRKISKELEIADDSSVWEDISDAAFGMAHSLFSNLAQKGTYGILDVDDMTKKAEKAKKARKEHMSQTRKAYQEWIDEFEEISKLFNKLIEKGLENIEKDKLFVFIDDLDRCLPENTIKLLESIKNFLEQDQTLFVIAIDSRIVAEMIEQKYGLHHGYGEEYLEKIINYNVNLPPADTSVLVKSIFDLHNVDTNGFGWNGIEKFVKKFLPEPRKAKRVARQFAIKKYLLNDKTYFEDAYKKQYLFITIFLRHKYPSCFAKHSNILDHKQLQHLVNLSYLKKDPSKQSARNSLRGTIDLSSEQIKKVLPVFRFQVLDSHNSERKIDHVELFHAFQSLDNV
jgi:ABC-type branched-subunit amino acid transport system ATPase component